MFSLLKFWGSWATIGVRRIAKSAIWSLFAWSGSIYYWYFLWQDATTQFDQNVQLPSDWSWKTSWHYKVPTWFMTINFCWTPPLPCSPPPPPSSLHLPNTIILKPIVSIDVLSHRSVCLPWPLHLPGSFSHNFEDHAFTGSQLSNILSLSSSSSSPPPPPLSHVPFSPGSPFGQQEEIVHDTIVVHRQQAILH